MRKYLLLLGLGVLALSCDDGDFSEPSFDFTETINYCNDGDNLFVLHKENTSKVESLILTLTDNQIRNSTAEVTPVNISETGNITSNYRLFSDPVDNNYFCSNVPPTAPGTARNWVGVDGIVNVKNIAIVDEDEPTDTTAFEHNIIINNYTLESNGETLQFSEYYYGKFTTPYNSTYIPSLFNFTDVVGVCNEFTLHRVNEQENEAMGININPSILPTTAGTVEIDLEDNSDIFVNYRLFATEVDSGEYFCAGIPPTTPEIIKNWEGSAGKVNVVTTVSGSELTHTIVITELVFNGNADAWPFDTDYTFGSFTRQL
ncbi:hypothetical protein [Aureivirga sp. CE67]|uniref:hypothetical protein n=1 Tax=Aureivirga sp. CE67 TaxID=1788983 RepID=UPI0018CA8841|nr:hypothetical protein [Aureivirga sp. CE67]